MTRTVELIELRSINTEDSGGDEIYLKVNGIRHNIGDMDAGQIKQLDVSLLLDEDQHIGLFDQDGPFDSDDNLGLVTISKASHVDTYEVRFARDGADYTLRYRITGDPQRDWQHRNWEPWGRRVRSRVQVKLLRIDCRDTEDVGFLGSRDEFYIVGTVTSKNETRAILTRPIEIDDGETKHFPQDQQVLFDGTLDADGELMLLLEAYDEDAAKNWEKHEELIGRVETEVETSVDEDSTLEDIWKVVKEAWQFFVSHDDDDRLGTLSRTIKNRNLRRGRSIHTWAMRRTGSWYSDWDYTVFFEVTKTVL